MRLIVTSQTDIAGRNIYRMLRDNFDFRPEGEFEGFPVLKKDNIFLIKTAKRQTEAEHLDDYFDAEYYVFASRHRSESNQRTLTVHVTGNLTERAEVGGGPGEVARCNPHAMKVAMQTLDKMKKEMSLDYMVSLEATHHGPTSLKKPVLFVEVGSTENEWRDEKAVMVVSSAALKAAENREEFPAAIGIGGNHYAPRHTQLVLNSPIAIGHIVPSYAALDISIDTFKSTIEKTGADFGYIDWKGMKKVQRDRMLDLSKKSGLEIKRGREVLVKEEELFPVDIPHSFLDITLRTDREGFNDFINKNRGKIDFSTESFEVKAKNPRDGEIVKKCLDILAKKYKLALSDDSLILGFESFDPLKAKKLGIKPGPEFGKLSRGESVRIDGELIKPGMVKRTNEKNIKITPPWVLKIINENV